MYIVQAGAQIIFEQGPDLRHVTIWPSPNNVKTSYQYSRFYHDKFDI